MMLQQVLESEIPAKPMNILKCPGICLHSGTSMEPTMLHRIFVLTAGSMAEQMQNLISGHDMTYNTHMPCDQIRIISPCLHHCFNLSIAKGNIIHRPCATIPLLSGRSLIDSLLTNAPDSTSITLTHSRNRSDTTPSSVESNAVLQGDRSTATMAMNEIREGVYDGLLSYFFYTILLL